MADKPKKMDLDDVEALVGASRADALATMMSGTLTEERTRAMDYYLGEMSEDMPAEPGRSKAVSTDVADVIEGLMPQLMDIFAGSDEVVRFEPVGPDDEDAAAQETDYINHVFMQENEGFMVLYAFIKDALLSKTGLVKVWWEESEQEERDTFYDLTEAQFDALLEAIEQSDGALEIIAHTEHDGTGDEKSDQGTS